MRFQNIQGNPVVYDFGIVPANSKSEIKSLPLMNYPIDQATPQSNRLFEFYTKANSLCERNSLYVSTVSDQIGYVWKIVADSTTSFHTELEIRRGSLIAPNLD